MRPIVSLSNEMSIWMSHDEKQDRLLVYVSADYVHGDRKSQLFIDEKSWVEDLERQWAFDKKNNPKLTRIHIRFNEIDYYDNMTNVYLTPIFTIERGKRKVEVNYTDHGSIPKAWSITYVYWFKFSLNSTYMSILDYIGKQIGSERYGRIKKQMIAQIKAIKREEHPETINIEI